MDAGRNEVLGGRSMAEGTPTVVLIDSLGWQAGIHNLGLAYLAACLKAAGLAVQVIDLNNRFRPVAEVVEALRALQPDYIGFSVKSATFANAVELHRRLLEACPTATYLYGGAHASLAGPAVLEDAPPAYFFRGEAERALPAFLRLHASGERRFRSIPGILYREPEGGVWMNDVAVEPDVDGLPFPDFSAFDSRASFTAYPLLTSRGCPYNCTYCSVPMISGKRWRPRSPESVLAELEHATRDLGLDTFVVVDDNFTLRRSRAEAICQAILDRGLQVSWSCANGIRADRIWPDLAALMHRAGCREVAFGVESADTEVLAGLDKGETFEEIRVGIQAAQGAGLKVTGFFMIGLPGSTYAKDLRTLAHARKLGLDDFYFGLTVPYPGTRLWDWAQEHARFLIPWQNTYHISEVFREGLDRVRLEPVFETPDYPAAQRKRLFALVQKAKGERAERDLRRRILRQPGLWKQAPVLIRATARENLLHLMKAAAPDLRPILLWKGPEGTLDGMNPDLKRAFETLRLAGEGQVGRADAADPATAGLRGRVVLFDAAAGRLDRYGNVLELARALEPALILALVGQGMEVVPLRAEDA